MKGGTPGSPTPPRRRARFDDMDIGLERRFTNPRDRIIVKVGLVDHAIGGGYLAAARHTGSKYGGALELRPHQHRIDDLSGIDRSVDAWNSKFSLGTHFDLHHGRYVRHETAMDGDTPAGSAAWLAFYPSGFSAASSRTRRSRPVSIG
jgi:hypothetical protein